MISTKLGTRLSGWKNFSLNSVFQATLGVGESITKNVVNGRSLGRAREHAASFAVGLIPFAEPLRKLKNTKWFSFMNSRKEKGIGTTLDEAKAISGSKDLNIVKRKEKDMNYYPLDDLVYNGNSNFKGNVTRAQENLLKKNQDDFINHTITHETINTAEKLVQKEVSEQLKERGIK